jgi:hypothetical protein
MEWDMQGEFTAMVAKLRHNCNINAVVAYEVLLHT